MGKTGGRELNYLSDVDVMFVHEPADGADEQKAVAGRHPAGGGDHAAVQRAHRARA